MAATFATIMKDLKARKFKPIYFLMGDEAFYIDKITKYISENVLTEAERSFNQTVLYGKDTDARTIDMTARRFPMMSDYQVVIIKEAQDVRKIEDLVHYAGKPNEKTILVISYKYKTLDKRKKLYKELEKNGVLFLSKKLYENKIPQWIADYVKTKGLQINAVATALLAEFLGTDLAKIANEVDKLALSLKDGEQITPLIIEQNIGISKDYNNFELQKALAKRDVIKANRIVIYFAANQKDNPVFVTINSLYGYFVKILSYHFTPDKSPQSIASTLQVNPYFVKDYQEAARRYNPKKTVQIISYLREYDLRSKGVNNVSTSPGELLKELIFKILH